MSNERNNLPKKYYSFTNYINKDTIHELLDVISENEGRIQIQFTSLGGEIPYSEALLIALNENKDRIDLLAVGALYSSAFFLFSRFEGKKKLSFGVQGMVHEAGMDVNLRPNGDPRNDYEVASKKNFKNYEKFMVKLFKKLLTKEEYKRYKSGKDVFLDYKRMKEIFE